ncbi:MAG: cysteine desulfurase [Chthoniobacterales bacterium]|nr:cysteine desulfurase [Chthoniobacterales bacterium]
MTSAGSHPIYLDYNATTPLDPAVRQAMLPFLEGAFGNPSSSYGLGRDAATAMLMARDQVAALLGARSSELVFTSSGTEATTTAFCSALAAHPEKKQIITSSVEHSATKLLCLDLEKRGYEILWLPVDFQGQLSLEQLEEAITPATALVSLIWGNNETGVLFPIEKISAITATHQVPLHVDAVQVVGKMPIDLTSMKVQYLSLSGHKIYAPKGIGALYVHRHAPYTPLLQGFQEQGRRGGTENVAAIVALGKAALLAQQLLVEDMAREALLRDRLEEGLLKKLDSVFINGDLQHRLPNTSHLIFPDIAATTALLLLDEKGVCCSAGSACSAGSCDPSSVLMAMGRSPEEALAGIRCSVGRFTTEAEIDRAVEIITSVVKKIHF